MYQYPIQIDFSDSGDVAAVKKTLHYVQFCNTGRVRDLREIDPVLREQVLGAIEGAQMVLRGEESAEASATKDAAWAAASAAEAAANSAEGPVAKAAAYAAEAAANSAYWAVVAATEYAALAVSEAANQAALVVAWAREPTDVPAANSAAKRESRRLAEILLVEILEQRGQWPRIGNQGQ